MENDKQITKYSLEQVKRAFLSDELLAKDIKPEIYSLPEEFAKSKKTKDWLVYTLILFYIAAIGVSVYFITTIEENKSKRVEVDIAEFRQFNLMELLAEKKANEEKLAQLQQELEELRANSMKEIKKLSPREQQKALAALDEKMKKLEEDYLKQIKEKEVAIQSLEKSIKVEQQQLVKNVQETETVIKNYQNLNQMQQAEIERLRTEYAGKIAKLKADHQAETEQLKKEHQEFIKETINSLTLKYNPVFSRGEMATAINSKLGNNSNHQLGKFNKLLAEEQIWNEQDYNQLQRKMQQHRIIIDNLMNIPFTNSIPRALKRLDQLSASINSDYDALWGALTNRLSEKNSYLNSYEYALNYLSMLRRESGFVIDGRNPNHLVIFIDHIYSIKKGDIAYIFKNDDQPIAKIELQPENGQVKAKVREVLKPAKIEPFDKILLKLEVAK